ncbi:MAG: hypothetical protein IPL54_15410 [Chitinophagaceae bacterium]|nr:hypothetical protein [Chitinophagaceae bacterium]
MKTENHITASCIISNNIVYKNGLQVFEEKEPELPEFLVAIYRHFELQYPKFHKMDNLSKLGWLANEILLQNGFDKEKYKPEDVGIVLSNANASLDTDIKYYETTNTMASPALFVYTLPNIVIGEMAIRHHFKGENAFFIFECFDAGFIEQYVSNMINNNILQCCICGWVDVLDKNYNATLFLIEQEKSANSVNFTKENLTKIHQLQNG